MTTNGHPRTFALVFDTGDEVIEQLNRWCREHVVTAARLTGVGGFSEATIAWFDWEARNFLRIRVNEQVEVLSLNGDVAELEGNPAIHIHVVLGTRTGEVRGGHLIAGRVRPTFELILDEVPAHLRKRHDPESGLALIAIDE